MKHHTLDSHHSFCYVGPSLEEGPLPALFYFSLSAEESLSLYPFNEPVTYLKNSPLRIFSMTIPGHEGTVSKEKAIETWAQQVRDGIDPLSPFITKICYVLDQLMNKNILIKGKIILAGLSRGGYIATLVAARHSLCNVVLGFAPITELKAAREFQELQDHPLLESLSLQSHLESLIHKKIRYYIGNRDTRVGTKHAFELISALATLSHEKRGKQGSFELIIGNSIGFMGHGTSSEVFKEGSQWIQKELQLI